MSKIWGLICLVVALAMIASLIFASVMPVSAQGEEEITRARLSVRNLHITPAYVSPRQTITINADVVNEGDMWGDMKLDLIINGYCEQSVKVSVSPGLAKSISFTVYKVEPGTYNINIEGATGHFTVLQPEAVSDRFSGGEPLGTGGIITIVFIGIMVIGGIAVAIVLTRP